MSITRESRAVFQPDVVVIGGGLIGLACATAIAQRGRRVLVVSSSEVGAASLASAGILAPSIGNPSGPARALGLAARDMYPAYVQSLNARTGVRVPLDRSGVLEVAFGDDEAIALRSTMDEEAQWVDATGLRDLEPALAPGAAAVLRRYDGAVDPVGLLHAIRVDAERDARVSFREGRVVRFEAARRVLRVELASGDRIEAPGVVMAAGAWVSLIAGLPRPLPVVPVRGQMIALAGAPVRHVVVGPHGYVVSRANRSLVGSTMERVGFDARTTEDGAATLRAYAREISPALGAAPVIEHWAGLRPVTPDFLPIVGADPDCEGLFYACGHSRNGVLLAPLTANVIADLVSSRSASLEVTAYAPGRFGG